MVRYTINQGVKKLKSRTKTILGAATLTIPAVFALAFSGVASAATPTPFFNGFETDTNGWFGNITRVASGTNGVTSAAGSYHAQASDNSVFTRWGGYTDTFPTSGYTTSVDINLNTNGGYNNDTRFDWDSSVSDTSGGFRRDFIFNCGYYNNTDATGSGPRFVCSASNNSSPGSAYPENPGRSPFAITASGWYTFQHRFYSNGGVLAVDLSILNSSGNVLHTWTLSDPSDIIGSTVGGNHYGWFDDQAFPFLAFDNSQLSLPPKPTLDWGSKVNPSQCTDKVGAPVVNVTEKIANDVDSGTAGNFWAFDNNNRQIQVWKTSTADTYCAVVRYEGQFNTIAGQKSPGNTTTLSGNVSGTFEGGYMASFKSGNGPSASSGYPLKGNIGSVNYACDSSGTCPGYVDWVQKYFGTYSNFAQPWWGWIYNGNNGSVWVNSSDGNAGDITG